MLETGSAIILMSAVIGISSNFYVTKTEGCQGPAWSSVGSAQQNLGSVRRGRTRPNVRGYPKSRRREGVGSLFHAADAQIDALSKALLRHEKDSRPLLG